MPLPDLTRISWASADARAVWEPRQQAVAAALLDMEIQSVRAGVRPVALQFTPDVASLRRIADLAFAPVTTGRCAVARDATTLRTFVDAWHAHDDVTVGRLLGFPTCCVQFFDDVWNVRKLKDTTLAMGGAAATTAVGCNILGRWLGVRLVPHLPCRWDCAATAAFARALVPCWDPQALGWADDMLSWPVEYSALHGLAIVVNPVVKVVTNTDYTATKQLVRREGTRYPAEAATGLQFPFQKPRQHVLSLSTKATTTAADPREWTDNGFPSKAAMDSAHAMVLAVVNPVTPTTVLDLGCGNGSLLRKVGANVVVGIEQDTARAAAAKARGVDVRVGSIRDIDQLVDGVFDVAMISQRRFDECAFGQEMDLRGWLERHATRVLVYSYDAPLYARFERMAVGCG